jgi:hypothetical protein
MRDLQIKEEEIMITNSKKLLNTPDVERNGKKRYYNYYGKIININA